MKATELERKLEEEGRMNEKIKEMNMLQKQYYDSII